MAKEPSTHPFIITFLNLYRSIRSAAGHPGELAAVSSTNAQVKQQCLELHAASQVLKEEERKSNRSFFSHVDPAFIQAWRDYEARYADAVTSIWANDFLAGLDFGELASPGEGPTGPRRIQTPLEKSWLTADENAAETAGDIRSALRFAGEENEYEDAIDRLSALDLDWRGIFRRREVLPFVLIPQHVGNRHGEGERCSLYAVLGQAHRAFVLGLPYACVALLRTVMEVVLKKHYGAPDNVDLKEVIRSVAQRLPREAGFLRLDALRRLANNTLHDADFAVPSNLELQILGHLIAIRSLIEHAPTMPYTTSTDTTEN